MEKTKHLFVYFSHKKLQFINLFRAVSFFSYVPNSKYRVLSHYMQTLTMIAKIKLVASFNPNAMIFLIHRVGFFFYQSKHDLRIKFQYYWKPCQILQNIHQRIRN